MTERSSKPAGPKSMLRRKVIPGALCAFFFASSAVAKNAFSPHMWGLSESQWNVLFSADLALICLVILITFLLARRRLVEFTEHFRLGPARSIALVAALIVLIFISFDYPDIRPRFKDLINHAHWGAVGFASFCLLSVGVILATHVLFSTITEGTVRRLRRVSDAFFGLRPGRFALYTFLVALLLTSSISFFALRHMPHSPDSFAYVFQAKIFAQGHLYAQAPENWEFFDYVLTIFDQDRWYSQYPPGYPLLLMIGMITGLEWLINPFLGSLWVVILYYLGKEIYDDRTGRLAALFAVLSLFWLRMSTIMLSHAATLFFLTLFVLLYVRTWQVKGSIIPLLSGLCLGATVSIRPLTGLSAALPFAVHGVYLTLRGEKIRKLLMMLLGISVPISLLLYYNYQTTGSPLRFAYQVTDILIESGLIDKSTLDLAGLSIPTVGPVNGYFLLSRLNRYLFFWPIPSLVFVLMMVLFAKKNTWDYVLLGCFLAVLLAYLTLPFPFESVEGPRYLYATSFILILLTVRGIVAAPEIVSHRLGFHVAEGRTMRFCTLLIALCFAFSTLYVAPQQVRQWYAGSVSHEKIFERFKQAGTSQALVFIAESADPAVYGKFFFKNSPDLKDDVLYVKSLGRKNRILMDKFPERRYYYYSYELGSLRPL